MPGKIYLVSQQIEGTLQEPEVFNDLDKAEARSVEIAETLTRATDDVQVFELDLERKKTLSVYLPAMKGDDNELDI